MKFFEPSLVAISLLAHANKWYVVSNDWLAIDANISSMCFLLAAALFTVQGLALPCMKYPWNRGFTFIYKVVVMLGLPTLVQGFVWMPLTYGIAAAHAAVARTLILMSPAKKQELFLPVVKVLTCPPLQAVEQMLLAVFTLYSVMVATGHYCQLKAWLASLKTQCKLPPKPKCPPAPACGDDDSSDSDGDYFF